MTESLYVHVPFCASKCGYCAFYSEPEPDLLSVERYLTCLGDHILRSAPALAPLQTLFIGGGTPTYLNECALEKLLKSLSGLPFAENYEWSVECNPETLTDRKAALLAEYGVNRVSLGVQSFIPRLRDILGRRGSVETVTDAVVKLRTNGISRLSGDLIYAVPTQTFDEAKSDLFRLLDLGVTHCSAYSLTAEEGSRCFSDFDESETEETAVSVWEAYPDWVSSYGLNRYEISNYAVPGAECRHNFRIWQGEPYLGLGPAAASFDGILRYTEPADLLQWLEGVPPESDPLTSHARAAELLVFGLRTVSGWHDEDFRRVSGYTLRHFQTPLIALVENGLLVQMEDCLYPTARGLSFWNEIASALLFS